MSATPSRRSRAASRHGRALAPSRRSPAIATQRRRSAAFPGGERGRDRPSHKRDSVQKSDLTLSFRFPFPRPDRRFPQFFDLLTSDPNGWASPVEATPSGGTRGTSYRCGGRAALPRSPATPPDAASIGPKTGLWRLWQLVRRLADYCLLQAHFYFFKRRR
jgi:hypothetical protein